jgi:uncharacterized ParB-like nuclease family protein
VNIPTRFVVRVRAKANAVFAPASCHSLQAGSRQRTSSQWTQWVRKVPEVASQIIRMLRGN